jgi:hypothetical protein
MALQTMFGGNYKFQITDTESIITDTNFYLSAGGVRLVRIARWYGEQKLKIIRDFLKPLSERIGFHLCYEVDDVLLYDEIPKYNIAREAFHPNRVGDSIKQIMELCDIITVTTNELKDLYSKKLNINPEKFLVIPNYLPRWWIGDSMNIDRQMRQYKEQKYKPTIAFACSTNHFDVKNLNDGIDDFSHIVPWIIKNMNKFNFTFVGGIPLQLTQFVQSGKIKYQQPSDILNYPREMQLRKIDLLLAPLEDNSFNRCKSNIKYLEFSALGIPMAGQNICTYNKYTDILFNGPNDLDIITNKLFFERDSEERYRNIIEQQRKVIDGENGSSGWWLEKNIGTYYKLYSLPQKTIKFDFTSSEDKNNK